MTSLEERFRSRWEVAEGGCWRWTGAIKNKYGHGAIKLGARSTPVVYAHRLAWQMANGEIPPGMCVCHRCDNPRCVNPDHLFLGTQRDNIDDMNAKGRNARGEKAPQSKITASAASEIRRRRDEGSRALGAEFGLSRQSIADILYGRTWKHAP